jgi:hypothetical protein
MMSDRHAMLLVRAMAVQANIDSMKAENAAWAARGQEPCYREHDFAGYIKDLETIAEEMRT